MLILSVDKGKRGNGITSCVEAFVLYFGVCAGSINIFNTALPWTLLFSAINRIGIILKKLTQLEEKLPLLLFFFLVCQSNDPVLLCNHVGETPWKEEKKSKEWERQERTSDRLTFFLQFLMLISRPLILISEEFFFLSLYIHSLFQPSLVFNFWLPLILSHYLLPSHPCFHSIHPPFTLISENDYWRECYEHTPPLHRLQRQRLGPISYRRTSSCADCWSWTGWTLPWQFVGKGWNPLRDLWADSWDQAPR